MAENGGSHCCGPGYASPAEAMKAPREKVLYRVALYIGTGIQKPDYLATIDARLVAVRPEQQPPAVRRDVRSPIAARRPDE